MALSQPVQNGLNDTQRELLASRYSVAAPIDPVLPGTKTAAPKAEEKHAFASQDWFERSSDKADGGRTALKNLMERMKKLAEAAEQREAAQRVTPSQPEAESTEGSGNGSMFVSAAPDGWWGSGDVAVGSTDSGNGGGSTSGSGSTGGSSGGGLIGKLFGG